MTPRPMVHGFSGLFTDNSEHICFLLFIFPRFFSFCFRAVGLLRLAHVKIAPRIISHSVWRVKELCSMSCITMGNTIAIQFFQDSAGQLKVATEFIAASPSAGGTVVESLNVAVIVCC